MDITGTRDAVRQAFNNGLVTNVEQWMQMIADKVFTVHAYNEAIAIEIGERICNAYFKLFVKLF